MDWWVVAAITGAGYAANYLQNFSQDRKGLSGLMYRNSIIEKPDLPLLIPHYQHKTSSLQNSVHRRSDLQLFSDGRNRNMSSDGRFGESTQCNSPSSVEIPSTSGFEGDVGDSAGEIDGVSGHQMGLFHGPRRGRNSLRSRLIHLQYLKPLNSLDSCLMAQLYKKHAEMEEHVLAPLSSPCAPVLRPLVVTDGTRVISRQSFDFFSRKEKEKMHMKAHPETNEVGLDGSPWLLERGSEASKERNVKKCKDQIKKLTSTRVMPDEMQMSSQGSPSGAALFCLGVSIGIMSSVLANKMEVTKLKDVLKQTENLVQDLQEELEMKDSLTVKELVSEDNIFPHEHESSIDNRKLMMAPVQSDSEVLIKCGVERSDIYKAPDTIESMNQIEAELEAELERLELNMKGSTLHGKFSDDDELNAVIAGEVQGELIADILFRKPTSDPSLDNGSSSSTNPCYRKQAVSPRELSLRLHQVIQSKLEQRIMELEAALEKSQKRVQYLESEQRLSCSWRGFSQTHVSSSSSGRGSPIAVEAESPVESESQDQAEDEVPLVMNLSGEALDAYNEAFEELHKINGSEYEECNFESIPREDNQIEASSLLHF